MSKRSTWCEFDKETRKYIKQRDGNECVVCHSRGALQIMHIFVSRAHGGRGAKENGCLGCVRCHNELDNGSNPERTKQIKQKCEGYLIEKENIPDIEQLKKDLIYHKQIIPIDIEQIVQKCKNEQLNAKKCKNNAKNNKKMQKNVKNSQICTKKCKNCAFLVKDKYKHNSTLPTYFCKYRKIYLNKSTKACAKYMEGK